MVINSSRKQLDTSSVDARDAVLIPSFLKKNLYIGYLTL